MKPEKSLRAFVAFELPEAIVAAAIRIQENFRTGGVKARWVRPGNMHLTLKFFGEIVAADMDAVAICIRKVARGVGSISLAGKGIGVFPEIRKPRVVWMGMKDLTGGLLRLHQEMETAFIALGYPAEGRSFTGHLTLGRFSGPPDNPSLMKVLEACRDFETEVFILDAMTLFRSELTPSGPNYTRIRTASLQLK